MTTAAEWLVKAATDADVSTASASAIAAAILAAAQATPVHSNVKQMNDSTVYGTGTESDKWRGNV